MLFHDSWTDSTTCVILQNASSTVQPDESLYMTFMSKEPSLNTMAMPPGLKWVPKMTVMDMSYAEQFRNAYVGDAYERMFLNAALGDQSLFVSADELVEMWRIFTPLLHQIDEQRPNVAIYPFGMVPDGWAEWAKARGAAPKATWQEFLALHSDQVEELRRYRAWLERMHARIPCTRV